MAGLSWASVPDLSPHPSTWLPPPPGSPQQTPSSGLRRILAGVAVVAVLVGVAAIVLGALVFRPHFLRVNGNSMAPAIGMGDYVLVRTTVGTIERGDVVAFRNPSAPGRSHVFRVIVLPGERFTIVGGVVQVNGKPLDEPYVARENRFVQDYGPYQLPANQYFLMGDNRRDAADSRFIGAIERGLIWGRWVHW
jgi:signal peptidase I